jgi:hypothetical protein
MTAKALTRLLPLAIVLAVLFHNCEPARALGGVQ